MAVLKIKRTETGDWHVADCRPCLPPCVSYKPTSYDSSLASDAHSMKKRSNCQSNLFDDSNNFLGLSSPVGTIGLPSFKKSRIHAESQYSQKYIPSDVCSPASSVDSCGDTSCSIYREELCSDADSSTLSSNADRSTLLRRKVGNHTLIVRWQGLRPQSDRSSFLRRKVGSYTLGVRCGGGVTPQARILHRSELKSYRRTLEEFYGNGALSWEQEGYLTELRARLNISNDEHMNEVRKLTCLGSDLDALSGC